MPGPVDLVLIGLILIGVPFEAMAERRRLQHSLAAGARDARLGAYRRVILRQWAVAIVLLGFWIVAERPLSALGMTAPSGTRFAIALSITIALIALFVLQLRAAQHRPQVAEQVRAAAADIAYLLPARPAEMRRFTWVGVTAGIVEELVYRGYLMWLLASVAPMWVALLASSLAFGIGHAYQGGAGIAKTGVVGLVLGALYWLSGSLWVPMLLHAAVDVLQGRTVYVVSARGDDRESPLLGQLARDSRE